MAYFYGNRGPECGERAAQEAFSVVFSGKVAPRNRERIADFDRLFFKANLEKFDFIQRSKWRDPLSSKVLRRQRC